MTKHSHTKRKWHATFGHGTKCNHSAYATWGYFMKVAKSRRLSVAELLERAVSLYEVNDTPTLKEVEDFQRDLQDRISLMEYRIGTTSPSNLDRVLFDFYQEILEEAGNLVKYS